MLSEAYIPYGGYYSSPFCRWQGKMANENAIELGANTARSWFLSRDLDPTVVEYLYYGITISQHYMFHSHNWAAGMLVDGKKNLPGLMINQACTTSATCIHLAAVNIEVGTYETAFALMSDRCSNGAHTIWPQPLGPGGEVESENWMMDNFLDPWGGKTMTQTAENVAAEAGITREECDAVALRRYEQYMDSMADDRAFQKRYMFPVEVRVSRKKTIMVEEDEGITPSTAEGLAKLKGGPLPRSKTSWASWMVPGKKFMVGLPMNPATKMFSGALYTSSGVPTCERVPSCMMATLSLRLIASTWSCVT